MMKGIAILGSTGSIGRQTLDVISRNPKAFNIKLLTARSNWELLIEQAQTFHPETVVITNKDHAARVREGLSGLPIQVLAGNERLSDVVAGEGIDIVLAAMVGFAGLLPVISAIQAGKQIALANKETLVVAGDLVTTLARKHQVDLLPVDSEHSAIFQCLTGEQPSSVEKIWLTASGGPFLNLNLHELSRVTREQALNHPNWSMGAKITIDSASMMNKGLEAIEAKWLFDLDPNQIDVIVHPQSIVHSLVQFKDGSLKAQLGLPDMRLPIQYALSYPERLPGGYPRFDFAKYPGLTFQKPDVERFPNLGIAIEVMKTGGNMPCVMNAANEIAVEAFLANRLGFLDMTRVIERTLQKATFLQKAGLNDYVESDREARCIARSFV
ncbi:MAG: 1-deoxy-D-xylulose-5-phosphate reductoisomerase [Bacteroidales bacterium]|jgi:1-deoxy-D-xylulose-5-phosphate reductoisomerase|nr:1-deoxy-D-xylulose-5-phosphate reductoisomerase [Bacteroidales bacterium]